MPYHFIFFARSSVVLEVKRYFEQLFENENVTFGEIKQADSQFKFFIMKFTTDELADLSGLNDLVREAINEFRERDIELYYLIHLPSESEEE